LAQVDTERAIYSRTWSVQWQTH